MKIIIKVSFFLSISVYGDQLYAVNCSVTAKQIQIRQETEAYQAFKTGLDKIMRSTVSNHSNTLAYAELINIRTKEISKYYATYNSNTFKRLLNKSGNEFYVDNNVNENPDLKIIKKIAAQALKTQENYILNIFVLHQMQNYNETHQYINDFLPKNVKIKPKVYITNKDSILYENRKLNTHYVIIDNNNYSNNTIYTLISDSDKFKSINATNSKPFSLYLMKDVINRYNVKLGKKEYLHFILPKEYSAANSWLYETPTSQFKIEYKNTIKEIGTNEYFLSSGELHQVDTISIELSEAKKQYNLYNSILVSKENSENSRNVLFQIRFDKPKTFTEEKIINLNNQNGKEKSEQLKFDQLKNALFTIRDKIKNKNESQFNSNNLANDNRIRQQFLDSLSANTPESKKTISYAKYELPKIISPEALQKTNNSNIKLEVYNDYPTEYYSISGIKIDFNNNNKSKIYFANYDHDNAKLPSFKIDDEKLNEINLIQSSLEKDKSIDAASKDLQGNQRDSDAELKILESFLNKTSKTGFSTEGKLTIYTSLLTCTSCSNAYIYFSRLRPHVQVEVYTLTKKDQMKLYNFN